MKIQSISFRNFKYVSNAKSIKIDFDDANSLIMGGPNGYGKTTVFDALELLITGKIRHFNTELLNRGKENISTLANDNNFDIVIIAEFVSNKNIILVQRTFAHENNFESNLLANDEVITDNELLTILGISKNLFELGIYISQMDSLNFLQQKYKSRKDSITGILDSTEIEDKNEKLKKIKEFLVSKFQEDFKNDINTMEELTKQKEGISVTLVELQNLQEDTSYVRLFDAKEYIFDKEFFDKELTFDAIISPLNDLIEFSQYQEVFYIKKHNSEINSIVSINKKIYTALFFSKDIKQCKDYKGVIDISNELIKLKRSYEQKSFYLNDAVQKALELPYMISQEINALILDRNSIENGMNSTQTSLSKILKQRSDFIFEYNTSAENSILPKDKCPLCGRNSERLSQLFDETEVTLKANLGLIANQLAAIIQKLSAIFEEYIIEKANKIIVENQLLVEKNNLLSQYFLLLTDELNRQLEKEEIVFINSSETISFQLFEENYLVALSQLAAKKKEETKVVSDELYIKFERISLEYYTNIIPYTESILVKKKHYISAVFSNTLSQQLKVISRAVVKFQESIDRKTERYNTTYEHIDTILKKYATANKQYQTSIASNIAVPMFVFSGKIIQNYPLGLGVIIEIENSSVVFKTGNMKSDIFNNLSTGQLNGVIISLLLSIKDIFASKNSLNALLIDDPLQTIDDISAISLIDLLSDHFKDTQILLSTHEDDKQYLMKKKYEQSNRRCKILNMQDEYLKL